MEKDESKGGHLPVYSVKVKFHGVLIKNEQLAQLFSESDRRALALAIFFAKINLKKPEEIKKLILVLDDPVTSFDENRIYTHVNFLKDLKSKISQLIILTHYLSFITCISKTCINNEIKYLKIKHENGKSFLSSSDAREFTIGEFEKMFSKIQGFINNEHSQDIKHSLRLFLEEFYIPTFFADKIYNDKQFYKKTLSEKIDILFSNKEVKNKFHIFRESLNAEHHSSTQNNEEDIRSLAREMMDYLFSLVNEQVDKKS